MELRKIQLKEDRKNPLFNSSECQELLSIYEDFYSNIGFSSPWIAYFILKNKQIVGTCSFNGAPENETVEISYCTFKKFENQGIASFACQALIAMARNENPKLTISAKTAPMENKSTHILKKHGFIYSKVVQDIDIGDAWLWLLKSPDNVAQTRTH